MYGLAGVDFTVGPRSQMCGLADVDYTSLKNPVETRWWSTHAHAASFCANKATLIYQRDAPRKTLVPSEVYNLSDNNWLDLEVIEEITHVIKTRARRREVHDSFEGGPAGGVSTCEV